MWIIYNVTVCWWFFSVTGQGYSAYLSRDDKIRFILRATWSFVICNIVLTSITEKLDYSFRVHAIATANCAPNRNPVAQCWENVIFFLINKTHHCAARTVVQSFMGKRFKRMEKFEELRAARSCVYTNSGAKIVCSIQYIILGAIWNVECIVTLFRKLSKTYIYIFLINHFIL